MVRYIVVGMLLTYGTLSIWANGIDEMALEELLPVDERLTYRVGVTELDVHALGEANQYLRWSVPSLLIEQVEFIREHVFTPAERSAYRRALLTKKRLEIGRRLDTAIDARDALLYSDNPDNTIANQMRDQEQQIAMAREQLMLLEGVDISAIEIRDSKPIEIVADSNTDQYLLSSEQPLHVLARQMDLDMVIAGRIEQQFAYLIIDLRIYNAMTGTIRQITGISAPLDDVGLVLPQLHTEIARELVGRPWATLHIEGVSPDTAVYLDGNLRGYGEISLIYIEHGRRTITLENSDYKRRSNYVIEIAPYEERTLSISLSLPTSDFIRMTSNPLGANVYLDSVWQGITPLDIVTPPVDEFLLLRKPNFYTTRVPLSPESPSEIHVDLSPAVVDTGILLDIEREEFYGSLGVFVLSAIVPLVLYGLYEDRTQFINSNNGTFQTLGTVEQAQYESVTNTLQTFQWVGIFASGALLINSIIELTEYVTAGGRYHGQ